MDGHAILPRLEITGGNNAAAMRSQFGRRRDLIARIPRFARHRALGSDAKLSCPRVFSGDAGGDVEYQRVAGPNRCGVGRRVIDHRPSRIAGSIDINSQGRPAVDALNQLLLDRLRAADLHGRGVGIFDDRFGA